MTEAELEKRVAELETELAWRRNHVCPQPYVPVPAGTCTCGTRGDLTYPPPCPVHGFPSQVFTTTLRPGQNICGGAADYGFGNVVINAGCGGGGAGSGQHFAGGTGAVPQNTHGCAGGGGLYGQNYTITIPAG